MAHAPSATLWHPLRTVGGWVRRTVSGEQRRRSGGPARRAGGRGAGRGTNAGPTRRTSASSRGASKCVACLSWVPPPWSGATTSSSTTPSACWPRPRWLWSTGRARPPCWPSSRCCGRTGGSRPSWFAMPAEPTRGSAASWPSPWPPTTPGATLALSTRPGPPRSSRSGCPRLLAAPGGWPGSHAPRGVGAAIARRHGHRRPSCPLRRRPATARPAPARPNRRFPACLRRRRRSGAHTGACAAGPGRVNHLRSRGRGVHGESPGADGSSCHRFGCPLGPVRA